MMAHAVQLGLECFVAHAARLTLTVSPARATRFLQDTLIVLIIPSKPVFVFVGTSGKDCLANAEVVGQIRGGACPRKFGRRSTGLLPSEGPVNTFQLLFRQLRDSQFAHFFLKNLMRFMTIRTRLHVRPSENTKQS